MAELLTDLTDAVVMSFILFTVAVIYSPSHTLHCFRLGPARYGLSPDCQAALMCSCLLLTAYHLL
jgi:hypothetical protein